MRVDKLFLKSFKNLKDFDVDFDVTSPRQVMVGRNGVGKSNLLEALDRIFRELDLEEESQFEYVIEYYCNGHYVKITSEQRPTRQDEVEAAFRRTYAITPDKGKPEEISDDRPYRMISQTEFYRRNRSIGGVINPDRLLPLYVFGYYSGVSGRFNEIFARHEEKYYREQIIGEEAPLRPLFLAKPHHSQFALLAFFASRDEPATQFLRDEFHIEGLESVLFALHEPYWKRPRRKDDGSTSIDERFWQAGGKVAGFLDSLYRHAFAPMSGIQRKRISVGQERAFERRFCFIPSEEALHALAEGLAPKEFFARLESTIFSDLVSTDGEDVKIRVRLAGEDKPITFKELSEGEQQLLTIIGLMRFTAQNESLLLLDEPDTHLNPAWCLDYLDNLRKYGVEPPNSQFIMTTHNPLTFAGLDKNEVVILEMAADGHITSQHPSSAPKGMGFQAILTSDFFGLRTTVDKETLRDIDRKRELGIKEDKTDEERKELALLNEKLGRLDFSKAARDPLYLEYIRAITAVQKEHPEIGEGAPDSEIWRLRKKIAEDIADELVRRGQME